MDAYEGVMVVSELAIMNKKTRLTAVCWLIWMALFALLLFDLWYLLLWPQYGFRPFRGLEASDVKSVKIVRSLREAEITGDDITKLVNELQDIRIYPPNGEYQELLGGRFVMFKMVLKNGLNKEIWLSDYDKYFIIDWIPYYRGEDYLSSEYGVDNLHSELVDQYLK